MKLKAQQEIAAPIEEVFAELAAFDRFERLALARGIEIRRGDPGAPGGLGQTWDVRTEVLGKKLDLALEVIRLDPPQGLALAIASSGITGEIDCSLSQLSPQRTRLTLTLELVPRTLGARLLLKPLELAEASVNDRFRARVAEIVRQIEAGTDRKGPEGGTTT